MGDPKQYYRKELEKIGEFLKPELEQALTELDSQIPKGVTKSTIEEIFTHVFEAFRLVKAHQGQFLSRQEQELLDADILACKKRFDSLRDQSTHIEEMPNSLQGAIEVTDFMMHSFQKIAFSLFQAGQFDDAHSIYSALSYINPYISDYHLSMAAIWHKKGRLDEAVVATSAAAAVDSQNPVPLLRLAALLLQKDECRLAKTAITAAEELVEKGSPHAGLLEAVKGQYERQMCC